MTASQRSGAGISVLREMSEFASFARGTMRYVSQSLDIGLGCGDAVKRWSRSDAEADLIRSQQHAYRRLDEIRFHVNDDASAIAAPPAIAALVEISAFDLASGRLESFASYRFLYERLIGAAIRPWLPAAFLAAANLPAIPPERRLALVRSVGEEPITTVGWSRRESAFIPGWVDVEGAAIGA